jgi:hypothetical protein
MKHYLSFSRVLSNGVSFCGDDCTLHVDHTEYTMPLPLVIIWLRNVPSFSALSVRSLRVLIQLSVWSCIRMCGTGGNTIHVHFFRILWHIPWLISAPVVSATCNNHNYDLQFQSSWHTCVATYFTLT